MARGLNISPKHGLNPILSVCFYCGHQDGTIACVGRLPNDAKAPREAVVTKQPCASCKDMMEQGIILIQVDESMTKDKSNPHRTGKMVCVKESALDGLLEPAMLAVVKKQRCCFVPIDSWERLGVDKA